MQLSTKEPGYSTLHTHTHLNEVQYGKVSDKTHKYWVHPIIQENLEVFFLFCAKPQHIGQQFSQQSQHHTPLMELLYSNSWQQFSAYTSNRFWVGPQAPQPFIVYKPTCTTLGLTRARNQVNRVSGVDSTSLWGAYLGVLSDTLTECVTQCANVPSLKQTPDTMQTMHY